MTSEKILLETWRTLDREKQQKVIEYMEFIQQNNQSENQESNYKPKTELGQKLWALRLKSLGTQPILNTWEEVAQELAQRRGGFSE